MDYSQPDSLVGTVSCCILHMLPYLVLAGISSKQPCKVSGRQTLGHLYLDALLGHTYANNRLARSILHVRTCLFGISIVS